jgi:hypothetical protein
MVACHVGVPGEGVTDVDGVRAVGVQGAVGLKGDLNRTEGVARGKNKRVALGEENDPLRFDVPQRSDGAYFAPAND